jgi:hypothetical protein
MRGFFKSNNDSNKNTKKRILGTKAKTLSVCFADDSKNSRKKEYKKGRTIFRRS